MHHVLDSSLFSEVAVLPDIKGGFDRTRFLEQRLEILEGEFCSPYRVGTHMTDVSLSYLLGDSGYIAI
jgi:hypothetical protein